MTSMADRKASNGRGNHQTSQTHRTNHSNRDGGFKGGGHRQPGMGNFGNNKPDKNKHKNERPQKPGNNRPHDNGNHRPNNPGHNVRPGVPAPGFGNHKPAPQPPRPAYNHSRPHPGAHMKPIHFHNKGYRYTNVLRNMIYHTVRGARYRNVWMVSPGVYVVSYIQGPYTFYRYLYPETGSYGAPIRLVYDEPGVWYDYGNNNRYFYEDGNVLRISLNGVPQTPWSLVPSVDLNLHF